MRSTGIDLSSGSQSPLRMPTPRFFNILRLSFSLCACCAAVSALAQTAPQQAVTDAAWINLQNLAGPLTLANSSGLGHAAPTPIQQQAEQFMLGSEAAQAFYTAYPGDSAAPQARKLEVVLALQSVQLGDLKNQPHALALSNAYLANQGNPPRDRFDVALTAGVLSSAFQGKELPYDTVVFQNLADSLHTEFGELSDVYGLYLSLMRTADSSESLAVARKLIAMKAPAWVAAEAQETIDRSALLGKPLDLILMLDDGKTINLAAPYPHPTLIYVWSNRTGAGDLAILGQFKSAIPAGTRVVYVSLQSKPFAPDDAEPQAPIAGIYHFEEPGLDGLTARALKVRQFPCVYVLTGQGVLAGFGRVEDIAALLGAANN